MNSLSKSTVFGSFIAVIAILLSGHAAVTLFPIIQYSAYLLALVVGLLILLSLKNSRVTTQSVCLAFFAVMIVCTLVTNWDGTPFYYLWLGCLILSAYGIAEIYSFKTVASFYLKTMTVLSCIALVGYLLVNLTDLMSGLPLFMNTNGIGYRFGLIFNYIEIIPTRNCGIFWEPGLFATHLAIASIFELILHEKPRLSRLFLFLICIITANSSAGFVLAFLIFMLYFVLKAKKNQSKTQQLLTFILLVFCILIALNFDTILEQTPLGENAYLQKLSTDSIFSSTRMNAIRHNLSIFLKNPLFGAGVIKVGESIDYVADTSTSAYMMSIFGFMGIGYTLLWIYGIFRQKSFSFFSKLLLTVIVLIILNKEPHHQLLFSWILLFYLIKSPQKPSLTKEHEGRS